MLVIILIIILPDGSKSADKSGIIAEGATLIEEDSSTDRNADIVKSDKISHLSDKTADLTEEPIAEEIIVNNKSVSGEKSLKKIPKQKEKKLYFIIDDAGYSIEQLSSFLDFPGNLTIAVLPGLPHSTEAATLIHKSGKQVFLHQPMEAVGKNNPGPAAIMVNMNKEEIRNTLLNNIKNTPFIEGFNNHMGSAVTSDPEIMETILKTASAEELLFTDSLTTGLSKCKEVAEKLGITIAQRDVFLDNVDNREAIMESMNTGLNIAENKGYAVMIGHVWSSELANTMMEIYPNLIEEGFTLEEMSDLLLGDIY